MFLRSTKTFFGHHTFSSLETLNAFHKKMIYRKYFQILQYYKMLSKGSSFVLELIIAILSLKSQDKKLMRISIPYRKKLSRTKFWSDKILVGQNFGRTKYLVGQNFGHLAKIWSLLSQNSLNSIVFKDLFGQNFGRTKYFSVKTLVTQPKLGHFCPTKFCPIRYIKLSYMISESFCQQSTLFY